MTESVDYSARIGKHKIEIDLGDLSSFNFVIYFMVLVGGYFLVKAIPSIFPVILVMSFVGGAILAAQILKARRLAHEQSSASV